MYKALILVLLNIAITSSPAAERLRVCATTADLGSLATVIGGQHIELTVFAKGGDDPHFIEPRPTFVKSLSRADVLIDIGMELEIGWLPPIVQQAGNAALHPGGDGRITAANAIRPLGVPTAPIDRSHGDIHATGNPHFLSDPLAGVAVARLLRDRFSLLRADDAAIFASNYNNFASAMATSLLGPEAVTALGGYDAALTLVENDQALTQLTTLGLKPGGWLGALAAHAGVKVVADHDQWPYFARRFSLNVIGFLEPKPGLPPTSRHLNEVAKLMAENGCRLIIVSAFFDRSGADVLAAKNAAVVIPLAHQVGSEPGTDDYLSFIDYDVKALAAACAATP